MMGNSVTKNRKFKKNTVSPSKYSENFEDANESITPFPDDILLDPRSPNIARTPLSEVLAGRFAVKKEQPTEFNLETPTNLLRKRILRDLGVNYTSKELNLLDPRSPSHLIPRTPLNLSFAVDEPDNTNIVSVEYSGLIEEASCRHFNEKLANITLDDADFEEAKESLEKEDEFTDGELAAIRQKYLETNFEFVGDEIQVRCDPRSPSINIFRTPMMGNIVTSKFNKNITAEIEMDENISPLLLPGDNKSRFGMLSSTPMVTSVIEKDAVQSIISCTDKIHKTIIYEDDNVKENNLNSVVEMKSSGASVVVVESIVSTPMKKFVRMNEKDENKPRTPLSIINRCIKAAEKETQQHSQTKKNEKENSKLNEQFTPQKWRSHNNEIHLSIRNNSSKIPIFKK